jgi:hypothetical protein
MNAIRRLLLGSVIFGVSVLFGTAQSRPVISPFPPYPGDDGVDLIDLEEGEEEKIFLDLPNAQLVVVRRESAGEIEAFRVDLTNRVKPRLQVEVTAQGEGRYLYSYTVANEADAPAPIETWFLEIPVPRDADPFDPADVALPRGLSPAWETLHWSWRAGHWAVRWREEGGGAAVMQGASRSDCLLEADQRPGFVMAYFQSPQSVPGLPEHLSEKSRDRLLELRDDLNLNSRAVLTLGPKFGAHRSLRGIAADFHVGISRLAVHGHLDGGSPFVRECLDYLKGLVDDVEVDRVGAAHGFTGVPETQLERSIDRALRIALGPEE